MCSIDYKPSQISVIFRVLILSKLYALGWGLLNWFVYFIFQKHLHFYKCSGPCPKPFALWLDCGASLYTHYCDWSPAEPLTHGQVLLTKCIQTHYMMVWAGVFNPWNFCTAMMLLAILNDLWVWLKSVTCTIFTVPGWHTALVWAAWL